MAILSTFQACNENSGEPALGEDYTKSNTNLTSIDTFSIELSTIIFDNLITSKSQTILVGNYEDELMGKISSRSFMQLGIPENNLIKENDTYDSLKLVLTYNKYSFGDTTTTQELFIYQLIENITYDDSNIIHDTSSFAFNPEPIGSRKYTPKPNSTIDTLGIRIRDEIGYDFFTKMRLKSEKVATNDNFIEYFPGLLIAAGEGSNSSIIGFKASNEEIKLKLFTSRNTVPATKFNYEFLLYDKSKQFNNITHDFSSTPLESLDDSQIKLPAGNTNGLSYLQGGIGVAIRADFPSIKEILLFPRGIVVDAKLTIAPLKNSNNLIELPNDIIAYKADNINRISKEIVSSELSIDELFDKKTIYTFDLTSYFNEQINKSYFKPGDGIIITLPIETSLGTTFKRMIADTKNKHTKLNIYYLTY